MVQIILTRMVAGSKRYPHTQVFADVESALVSDEDTDLAKYRWSVKTDRRKDFSVRQYAYRTENGKTAYLHRIIAERVGLQLGPGLEIDHRDGNGLNNQRSNLRVVTHSKNMMNTRKQLGTSRYKGVCWHRHGQKWAAQIVIEAKQIHLGYYDTEVEAARAYDRKAVELFGDHARLNFPRED